MRSLGGVWQQYQALGADKFRYKFQVTIDNVIVSSDKIYSLKKNYGLSAQDFELGNTISARLDLEIFDTGINIPKNAQVVLEAKIDGHLGSTPWVKCGEFYVDYREAVKSKLKLECYDCMLYAEQPYAENLVTGDWPRSMLDILQEIATRIHTTLAPGVAGMINSNYYVPYPNKLKCREILGFIAASHGGNFYINDNGELQLWKPNNGTSLANITTGNMKKLALSDSHTFTKVYMTYDDDGTYYQAGSEGKDLEVFNLFATQDITDNVAESIQGYTYNSAMVTNAKIDLALELGDSVTIDGKACNLWNLQMNSGGYMDIHIPTVGSTQREFGFSGSTSSAIKRKVGLGSKYYGVTISRQRGIVIEREDGLSEAVFNSDEFSMSALVDGEMVKCIYFDPINRKYMIKGEVTIDGSLITQTVIVNNLYAGNATVSNLTVDKLRTDYDRVFKYLNADQTPINYIYVRDEKYEMINAVTTGVTEQFKDSEGHSFYWADETHKKMDIIETAYPVTVYTYTETKKAGWSFEEVTRPDNTKTVIPVMTFGASTGLATGSGEAKIYKDLDSFNLTYVSDTHDGVVASISMKDDGKVYINGELHEKFRSPLEMMLQKRVSGVGTITHFNNYVRSFSSAPSDSSDILPIGNSGLYLHYSVDGPDNNDYFVGCIFGTYRYTGGAAVGYVTMRTPVCIWVKFRNPAGDIGCGRGLVSKGVPSELQNILYTVGIYTNWLLTGPDLWALTDFVTNFIEPYNPATYPPLWHARSPWIQGATAAIGPEVDGNVPEYMAKIYAIFKGHEPTILNQTQYLTNINGAGSYEYALYEDASVVCGYYRYYGGGSVWKKTGICCSKENNSYVMYEIGANLTTYYPSVISYDIVRAAEGFGYDVNGAIIYLRNETIYSQTNLSVTDAVIKCLNGMFAGYIPGSILTDTVFTKKALTER